MPEVKVQNMYELEGAILELLNVDRCKKDRISTRNRMFCYQDGNASKRITKRIKGILN